MKKLIMAAAALTAGIVLANDSIVSSTVVGYQVETLVSGNFNMQGIPYLSIGTSDQETFNINDLVFENLTPGEGNGDGDEIRVWNPSTSGYTVYYYYNNADYPEDTGWYGLQDEDPVLYAGTAYWYYSPVKISETKKSQASGTVETSASVQDAITGGNFNMLISAYPEKIELNNKDSVEFMNLTAGEGGGEGDEIRIWDPTTSGYTVFYYYNNSDYPEDTGWYGLQDEEPIIPSNKAFWFYAQKGDGKTITYKTPIK